MPKYVVVQVEGLPASEEVFGKVQASLSEVYVKPPSTNFVALLPREVQGRLRFKGRRGRGRCSIFLTDQWELYVYGDDVRDCLKELRFVKEGLRRCAEKAGYTLIECRWRRQEGVAELLSMIGPLVVFLIDRLTACPLYQVAALLSYLALVTLALSLKALHVKALIRSLAK